MRILRVVVSRGPGRLPALLVASLMPGAVASCEAGVQTGQTSSSGGQAAAGGSGNAGGMGLAGGGAGTPDCTPDGGLGGAPPDAGPLCDSYEMPDTYVVELPPEGVPAEPGQLCTGPADPVESNWAAHVSLHRYSQALYQAQGQVSLDAAVLADVVGLPTIEVVNAFPSTLTGMQVTNVQPATGGFTFHAEWPQPFDPPYATLTVRATFQIDCAESSPKTVQANTFIHLCDDYGGLEWVSSCEWCTLCVPVCEMAPSPIVPSSGDDDLPLSRALRLTVAPVARVGRSVVLLAENDGGPGLDYTWRASGGEIRQLAPDLVIWTAPDGADVHQVQVAVEGPDAAAVASFGPRLAA